MDFNQLKEIQESDTFLDDLSIEKISDFIAINNYIPFTIKPAALFSREASISIKYRNGHEIGELKFLKNKYVENVNSLPEIDRICFFLDCDAENIKDVSYTFKNDYFIIRKKYYKTYIKEFKKSSPIWGSFFHNDDVPQIEFNRKQSVSDMFVERNLALNNKHYIEVFYLALIEPNPFNRFLKLYHLLELQFDLHTAEKIKSLLNQTGKEKEISSLLRDYSREDLERLKSLIKVRCNLENLLEPLNNIKNHLEVAKEMFHTYGKSSNPIKSTKDLQKAIQNGGFSKESATEIGHGNNYEGFISKLAAYWIYRIRSSIAHNKLGEYLMTSDNEEFITEFAEPLIRKVILECFKLET